MTPEAHPSPTAEAVAPGRALRTAWLLGGLVAVGFGGLGIIVPGLPTTVFFIVAAWCFSRSSPRMEAWVLGLPTIGPLVQDHRAGLGMPQRAKVIAVSMMWAAIIVSAVALRDLPWVVAAVVALGMAGTTYIVWRVPTREAVLAERAAATTPPDR